jgi:hypothetical protein
MAIYLLADLMGTIYPPPDLLFSDKQNIPHDSTATGIETHSTQQDNTSLAKEEKTVSTGKAAS